MVWIKPIDMCSINLYVSKLSENIDQYGSSLRRTETCIFNGAMEQNDWPEQNTLCNLNFVFFVTEFVEVDKTLKTSV